VGATVIDQVDRLRTALADRYELDREIGSGGMAHVYHAYDRQHEREVAIKIMRPELSAAIGMERFLREIRIEARLQHPNILPLHDSGAADGLLYYVMPFVDGESLRDRIKREKQLPVPEAIRIAREVADALDYAHQHNVVHRDIKPGNILLSGGHPLVADFGLARALSAADGESLTASGIAVGTAEYMSPEQASGESDVDGRSDIYALGCVLYEMLAGDPPFTGRTVQSVLARHRQDRVPPLRVVRPLVPRGVELAVERSLAKIPADRFATARAFAVDLGEAQESEERSDFWRSWRRPLGVSLSVVLFAALGFAAIVRRPDRVPSTPIGVVVVPFDVPADTHLAVHARSSGHLLVAEALDWVPNLRSIDGSELVGSGSSVRSVPLSELLRGAARLGGSYLMTGAILPGGTGVRVSVDLYSVSNGQRVIRGVDSTAGAEPSGPIGRLAVQSIAALAGRERLDLGARKVAFTSTTSAAALGYLLQGQAKFWSGDYDGAAAAYRSAIDADSSCGLAYLRLGDVHGWRYDYSAAFATLEAGLRHRPQLPARWTKLLEARRQFVLGNGEEAIARFQDAVLDDREDIDAWLGLGESLYHFAGFSGHPSMDAQPALERTVQLDSAFAPIYDHLVDLGLIAGDSARAAKYVRRMRPGDPSRSVREAAIQVRFGPPGARRAALDQLRQADRQALSQVIALWVQGAADLPLADTLASYLTGTNRTPDDRRRGAEFRLTILAAQGRWGEAEQVWRKEAGTQPFDAWMVHAYFAGYPAAKFVKPMFSWAQARVASKEIPDFSLPLWDERQQGFQALAHRASLMGDSAEVLELLTRMKQARQATDLSDATFSSFQASLEARLALLAGDSTKAIALLQSSVSRINEAYTWYYPQTSMAPERRLLSQLFEARGNGTEAQRWRDSFSRSWSIGDALFAAPASIVAAAQRDGR
jgi:tRNA A-37 threonylcarbamoyl transferase component Bud32/tetratricopeptide (TPR) repeat protein